VNGVLPIDKPVGVTSHDVVAAVRRALGGVKTGHAGTLDPFASGLLLVLVGRATRIQRHMMGLRKRYEVVARLGALSSTGDTEGEIAVTGHEPPDDLPLPTGELRQRPPIYSAVKVGGERAYKRARRGERFEMPPRQVTVYRFEQLWREGGGSPTVNCQLEPTHGEPVAAAKAMVALERLPRAGYLIECSAGTYVRSLIADLHDAYCLELRRTAIGPFEVENALAPPRRGEPWELPDGLPIPLEAALHAAGLPSH
jgi:tRNA pseudouridine55 synthase